VTDQAANTAAATMYERVGGETTFRALVHEFYRGVATDPLLRPLYPEEDLGPAEERLALFLIQYWGGPRTYGEQRGHPRLRMRHAPFRIDSLARDRWLLHMRAAMEVVAGTGVMSAPDAAEVWTYLEGAAQFMVNAGDPLEG
jgi:hemoglobin